MSLNVAVILSPSIVEAVCNGLFVLQAAIIAVVSAIKILRIVFSFFLVCEDSSKSAYKQ